MATARLSIAVTDRNPHVREFLCRELAQLGHGVRDVSGTEELLAALSAPLPPQVLLLDPEAAGTGLGAVLRRLDALKGRVAVLLHVFEGAEGLPPVPGALVVEKQPHMGALKTALSDLAGRIGGCAAPLVQAGAGHAREGSR